jgi:hypothetical protein
MQRIIDQLDRVLIQYTPKILAVSELELSTKVNAKTWSKREILGHLIDSAQNNIRRFLVAQYEPVPSITYAQDQWVKLSHYQHWPTQDLIELWVLLNRQISRILAHFSDQAASRTCDTGGLAPTRLDEVAADYMKHLLHHVHQIVGMEPVAYP